MARERDVHFRETGERLYFDELQQIASRLRGLGYKAEAMQIPSAAGSFDNALLVRTDAPLGVVRRERGRLTLRSDPRSNPPVTRAKAKKILREGKVRGKKLTARARRFFGARASGQPVRENARRRVRKFVPPFRVDSYEERDNLTITLYDANDVEVASWYDDDARQLFEDGFFEARRLQQSVIEYARHIGLLPPTAERYNKPRRSRRLQPKRTARGRTRSNPLPRGRDRGLFDAIGSKQLTTKLKKSGGYVHSLKYEDANDHKNYVHDFEDLQAIMYLVEVPAFGKGLLIVSSDDNPLWEDA